MTGTNNDFAEIKSRLQKAWSTGNYAVVGTTLQIVGESLCEAVDLRSGARVLDVAAGNGNATLAAARRFAEVTSTDYVPALLESGRSRAAAEGASVHFQEADAENLPFPDGSFDVVLSTFGVMFTPDQEKAASELARVCKPGREDRPRELDARRLHRADVQDHRQARSARGRPEAPSLWGTRARIEELFGSKGKVQATSRHFSFRYRSPQHFIEVFRTWYGPMNKTFAALDGDRDRQAAFGRDLLELIERGNRSGDGTMVVPSEYLEVVIERNR